MLETAWQQLYECAGALQDLRRKELKDYIDQLRPIRKTVKLALDLKGSLDPDLTPASWITDFETDVGRLYHFLFQFLDTNGETWLERAETSREALLKKTLIVFPLAKTFPRSPQLSAFETQAQETLTGIQEAQHSAEEQLESTKQSLEQLSEQAGDIESGLTKHATDIETAKQELFTATEKATTYFTTQKSEYLAAVDEKFEALEEDFEAAQTSRKTTFETSLDEIQAKFRKVLIEQETAHTSKAKSWFDKYSEKIENWQSDAEIKYQEIKKIYGLFGRGATAATYSRAANREARQAFGFRVVAVVFLIAAVAWAYWSYKNFGKTYPDNFDLLHILHSMLRSSPLTGLLLLSFAFCARQSGQHANKAQQFRRQEQQVLTVEPHLARLLGDDEQATRRLYIETLLKPGSTPTSVGQSKNEQAESDAASILSVIARLFEKRFSP